MSWLGFICGRKSVEGLGYLNGQRERCEGLHANDGLDIAGQPQNAAGDDDDRGSAGESSGSVTVSVLRHAE
jgi:hypothetical protein